MRQLRVVWWGTVLFGPPGILGQARDSSGVRILPNPPSHTVPVRFRADPVPGWDPTALVDAQSRASDWFKQPGA